MSRFPTAGHFAAWARVCPGDHESAGKRRSASTGKGDVWLRAALSQAAWAASRTKGSYYRALYHRHKARGGPKKAIVAVQHPMMVAIWHMFSRGTMHADLGPDHFQGCDKKRRLRYLRRPAEQAGRGRAVVDYEWTPTPRKFVGVTILMPRKGSSTRRSASPVMIQSARPQTASSSTWSSFGSRQA